MSRLYAQKRYDPELWDELKDLKREMAGISMVNEFAKYARLQRKSNKVESVLKDNSMFLHSFLNMSLKKTPKVPTSYIYI